MSPEILATITTLGVALIAVLGTLGGGRLSRKAVELQVTSAERETQVAREVEYLREAQSLIAQLATALGAFMTVMEKKLCAP